MKSIGLFLLSFLIPFLACAEPTVVILLGGPGAGKGSQAVKLKETLQLPHISTGDLFRENLKNGTPVGQEAKRYMEAGQLVPDAVVIDMLMNRIAQPDASKGYILDGFPRTLAQAQALDKKLPDKINLVVINLAVNDDTIIKRITGRLVCQQCGAPYHKEFHPSQNEGLCDLCKTALIQRSDDTEAVVRERLRVYHEQSDPVINFYTAKGVLHTVNGSQSPEVVAQDIAKLFLKN